jgi:hypothetical protein
VIFFMRSRARHEATFPKHAAKCDQETTTFHSGQRQPIVSVRAWKEHSRRMRKFVVDSNHLQVFLTTQLLSTSTGRTPLAMMDGAANRSRNACSEVYEITKRSAGPSGQRASSRLNSGKSVTARDRVDRENVNIWTLP